MMTSQILKFVDFTKIQKSRYLESEALLFLQIEKSKKQKHKNLNTSRMKYYFFNSKNSLITHQGLLYSKSCIFSGANL